MGCETPPAGRRGIVIGIAGETTFAYRCARRLRDAGAELAITWANDRPRPLAKPLGEDLQANVAMPLDVEQPGAVESLFETIHARWRRLDFVLHCIALAPSLSRHRRLVDASRGAFLRAMDMSCCAFVRMARLAARLMDRGGSLIVLIQAPGERAVAEAGLMRPVTAALEACARGLALELEPRCIRVHAVSAKPMAAHVAERLETFDDADAFAALLVGHATEPHTGIVHNFDATSSRDASTASSSR